MHGKSAPARRRVAKFQARVAQLAEASGSGPEGWRFESSRGYGPTSRRRWKSASAPGRQMSRPWRSGRTGFDTHGQGDRSARGSSAGSSPAGSTGSEPSSDGDRGVATRSRFDAGAVSRAAGATRDPSLHGHRPRGTRALHHPPTGGAAPQRDPLRHQLSQGRWSARHVVSVEIAGSSPVGSAPAVPSDRDVLLPCGGTSVRSGTRRFALSGQYG